jgi:hypothetical protein
MARQKEDMIEKFFRENRSEFASQAPAENHMEKFLAKLNGRFRHFVSIVPHLVKVAVLTLVIFAASVIVWNNFIRRDRDQITLRNKVSLVLSKLKGN